MNFDKTFLKKLLLKVTARKRPANAREFYWTCIKDTGYSEPRDYSDYPDYQDYPENNSDYSSDSDEDPYSVFKRVSSRSSGSSGSRASEYYEAPGVLGVSESQQMSISDQYGFNRTFIEPLSNNLTTSSGNRLSEINTWINVSQEETELKKVIEKIDQALNSLGLSDQVNIRRFAVNMYWNIMLYYKKNTLGLSQNKGNLKNGYITLVIYYSLNYFKRNVGIEQVVRVTPDSRLNYIPKAKKNIKQIFLKSPNYSFLNAEFSENISSECNNLIKILPNNIQVIINKIIEHLGSTTNIAAVIYYVTSVPLSKGGILQKRLVLENNKKITTEFLINKCGKIAPATLSKIVNNIINFYNNNPLIKAELMN